MAKTEEKSFDASQFLHIGQIYREHGIKGFCKVHIFSGSDENLREGETYALVSTAGKVLEVTLDELGVVGRYFLVHFKHFTQPEQIHEWRKAALWIDKSKLEKKRGETYDYEWQGFKIEDEAGRLVGTIREIAYTPLRQFVVETPKDPEALVPYQQEWIVKVDKRKKTVIMQIPEGLVEF